MSQNGRSVLQKKVSPQEAGDVIDFLARHSGLSRSVLKDAMGKGAVWLKRGRSNERRLRRARSELKAGDVVSCYYDPELLARTCPEPELVADEIRFSIWFKPAGLLAQGTRFGDHCALERFVEKRVRPTRAVHLIHRLDRETAGLMVFAHDRVAAAAFSALFRTGEVEKRYRAEVMGDLAAALGESGALSTPVDGKPSVTRFTVLGFDLDRNITTLDLDLQTGRTHQIRRQLADAGFPVIGDPEYGSGNKNREGLRLLAWHLAFGDPLTGQRHDYSIAPEAHGFG